MTKERRRSKWRVQLSASEENVRFNIQGDLGRRAAWVLIAAVFVTVCALLAPEVVAEIARLLKVMFP